MAIAKQIPELAGWLKRVVAAETPGASVVAFNVGLFETENGFSGYLVGAERYDANDSDWACDGAFTPSERYCTIPADDFDGWEGVHAAVVETIRKFLSAAPGVTSFLAYAEVVTVGIDGGDLERVK